MVLSAVYKIITSIKIASNTFLGRINPTNKIRNALLTMCVFAVLRDDIKRIAVGL